MGVNGYVYCVKYNIYLISMYIFADMFKKRMNTLLLIILHKNLATLAKLVRYKKDSTELKLAAN